MESGAFEQCLCRSLDVGLAAAVPSPSVLAGAEPRVDYDTLGRARQRPLHQQTELRAVAVSAFSEPVSSPHHDTVHCKTFEARPKRFGGVMKQHGEFRIICREVDDRLDDGRSRSVVHDHEAPRGATRLRYVYCDASNAQAINLRGRHYRVPMATPLIANRYRVQRQLGLGGQGEVYEVVDTFEGDTAALKLLTRSGPSGPWIEAQILRRLADPHILPIRNADLASGRPYIVTELAIHGDVDRIVAAAGACGLSVDDAVRLTRHACFGVARGHDLGLLHNDIKPGNLFLNAQRECLVGDFGLASLIPPDATATAPRGATPETAAPEVAAGWNTPAATASIQSDVYSLGATAFWMLTGRPPLDLSTAADFDAKMALVAAQAPPRLREVAPHVPGYVATAIEQAMARAPADRFATVTDFAAALGRRPGVSRRWARTDEHATHIACWRGDPNGTGSTYVVCLDQGPRATQATVTAQHLTSGRRIPAGCRSVPMRTWAQAVRSVMRVLS